MRACLPRCAIMVGLLIASPVICPAAPVQSESLGTGSPRPSSAGATPRGRSMVLDDQSPPQGPIIVSQIHNAPGWQPSHTYNYATGPYTRVVSGPGWNAARRSYSPSQTLNAYQLISRGTCTSASDDGPGEIGSAIHDGTCVWKYLSRVDYISITGWAFDNRPWDSGTVYHFLDTVTSGRPLRAYTLENRICDSSIAPTGRGGKGGKVNTGDGCHWQYEVDILYTSRRSYIPTETFGLRNGPATLRLRANYEAHLWNDREYVAGQAGEASPIRIQHHDDYLHEGGALLGCSTSPCYHIIITTAPGESFRDNLLPSDPLTGYDPSKGVAIRNSLPYRWPYEPAGIDVHDNFVDLIGLQLQSVHGAAVNGLSSFANHLTIRDCILDGGSSDAWTSHAAVTTDTSSVLSNSLVISHGPYGVILKYPGFVLHSTIVNPDQTADSVGIATYFKWVFHNTTVSNTAIFGFTHAVAHVQTSTAWSSLSSHNVTDAPSDDTGLVPWPYGRQMSTVDRLPGTTYGVSATRVFVKPEGDWRLSGPSPLRGAGSAFGSFTIGCDLRHPSCPQVTTYDFDTPDIIGTARPQHTRYDIGAWQSPHAPSPASEPDQRTSPYR